MQDTTQLVGQHYDAVAAEYDRQYRSDLLHDPHQPYPANYFRLQLLLNSFVAKGLQKIVEVGTGEGTPLATMSQAGLDVWGFDISPEMVRLSQKKMQELGIGADRILSADIQDPISYAPLLRQGPFDGLLAMGVMPHVTNDDMVLKNMTTLVRPGGSVFIEFRNSLFSLFTFNRHTRDFILDELLGGVRTEVRDAVAESLNRILRTDLPPVRERAGDSDAPGYDRIGSRFHNPLEIFDLFRRHGFTDMRLLWYHYHPAMPYLEVNMPELYREEALRLEHEASGWRGMFLCSAFVVEAVRSTA